MIVVWKCSGSAPDEHGIWHPRTAGEEDIMVERKAISLAAAGNVEIVGPVEDIQSNRQMESTASKPKTTRKRKRKRKTKRRTRSLETDEDERDSELS